MATAMRVTGAWTQLLTDWLDTENLPAPQLRAVLDSRSAADVVPLTLWRSLLQQAIALRPERLAPGLEIGALIQPRHVGMLGYLILTCRTLQRRLAERHLTWRGLLDRTREQLARHYLSDESLTLAEIALLLGFSEHSAFSRAYRQWTGTTPEKTRKLTKFS
jgi:AraC-like DNA-binding protein